MLDREELRKRIHEYIAKYGYAYYDAIDFEDLNLELNILDFIEQYCESSYYHPKSGENVFFQIFSAIDALPNEKNPYYQMIKDIEETYGLDKDIIEVGCGYFPALAYEISKRQKEIGKGTITAYDPKTVIKTLDGVKIVKSNFTLATPIPKNGLIIGRKPCKATETMIRSATKNEVELYIQLCNCNHIPQEYLSSYNQSSKMERWESYLEKIALDTLSPNFQIEKSTSIDPLVGDQETIIKIKKLKR